MAENQSGFQKRILAELKKLRDKVRELALEVQKGDSRKGEEDSKKKNKRKPVDDELEEVEEDDENEEVDESEDNWP